MDNAVIYAIPPAAAGPSRLNLAKKGPRRLCERKREILQPFLHAIFTSTFYVTRRAYFPATLTANMQRHFSC